MCNRMDEARRLTRSHRRVAVTYWAVIALISFAGCKSSPAEPGSTSSPGMSGATLKVSPSESGSSDTRAIQNAIDACSKAGGGEVEVTSGTYHVTPIELRDNVDFHLDKGAKLIFSRSFDDYPMAWVDNGSGTEAGVRSPIWGENLKNISITGSGVIDGQGDAWRSVKKSKLTPEAWDALVHSGGLVDSDQSTWYPSAVSRDGQASLTKLSKTTPPPQLDAYIPYRPLLRPHLIRLVSCTGVKLDGVTFQNSASWNVHISLCDQVTIHGITIFNTEWAQNGDGIDIDSCTNVTMTDSNVNAGDDGICLKSGMNEAGRKRARPTANITIARCNVGTGHGGVVIGSEMSGGVSHVNVSDCTFTGTGNGLRFKSVRGRGGVVNDVHVTNVKMSDIKGIAILFDLYYFVKPDDKPTPPVSVETPAFRDFHISNITCDGAKVGLQLRGLPEMALENITLDNVKVNATTAGMIVDTKDVTCRNVDVHATDGSLVTIKHDENLKLENSTGFAAN